jgi:hypothetical protein
MFEDAKWVIRSSKSKKGRQWSTKHFFAFHCFSFSPFSFSPHCSLHFSIYGFWFSLWYLHNLLALLGQGYCEIICKCVVYKHRRSRIQVFWFVFSANNKDNVTTCYGIDNVTTCYGIDNVTTCYGIVMFIWHRVTQTCLSIVSI